jgi:hypothetical protein
VWTEECAPIDAGPEGGSEAGAPDAAPPDDTPPDAAPPDAAPPIEPPDSRATCDCSLASRRSDAVSMAPLMYALATALFARRRSSPARSQRNSADE